MKFLHLSGEVATRVHAVIHSRVTKQSWQVSCLVGIFSFQGDSLYSRGIVLIWEQWGQRARIFLFEEAALKRIPPKSHTE